MKYYVLDKRQIDSENSDYMTIGTYRVECSTSDELKECIMNSMEKGLKPLLEMGEIECES